MLKDDERLLTAHSVIARQRSNSDCFSYAALAEVCAAFAAFSRASLARICDTVSCTWLSKTYCAGRWFSMAISGAIGPLVLMPRQATASALSGCFIMASAAVGS